MKKINLAKISQILFLILFLFLFVRTEYRGSDEISLAINSFFRANPLVVVSYFLANFSLNWLLLPGIIMIFGTALLGRFFCGWICPLGTTIDLATKYIKKGKPLSFLKTNLKYYLLILLLFTSLFRINITGLFEPIAIFVRFLTFSFFPFFGEAVRSIWVGMYEIIGDKREVFSLIYNFLKSNILPFRETFYPFAFFSLFIFGLIIFLERFEKRNWCKNLCPLGTLLSLLSKFSLFNRIPMKLCNDCGECRHICPTTFDKEIFQNQDCILCIDCVLKCKYDRAKFIFTLKSNSVVNVSKRKIIFTGLLGGYFLSKMDLFYKNNNRLLRPPGVVDENDFLKKCVRCGECIKICLKNALYPATLEYGLANLYTPVLIPRKGYCEYNCTLCGQVCPTKAIPKLPPEIKKRSIIGIAVFDKNHCLPYAKKVNCMVCEEHCPVPKKAIRFDIKKETNIEGKEIVLKKPYVVDELCIGCGICEYVCPLTSKPGIEVYKVKEPLGSNSYGYNGDIKIS
jgi:MauM/NapG family ferredoxin protein